MPTPTDASRLVHDHLVQDGGAERVVRAMMQAWPEAPVYTLLYDAAKMGPDFKGQDIRTSYLQKIPGALRHYKWFLTLIDGAFRRFDFSDYDIVVSSSSGWAKSVRTSPDTLHICYCHTPTRYLWSDADRYIAETGYPAPLKALFRMMLGRFRKKDLRAAKGVDTFIANSRHVAKRIKQYYHRDASVIYPPVDIDQFKPSRTSKDYFLIGTRLEPYKRVDLVIETLNRLKLPLMIMGDGTDRKRLERLAGSTVTFLGRVSDAKRRQLFAETQALLNPQEEDFGITTVEALASGTPVIAYGVGGAAEIITPRKTGLLFTPQTSEALEAAVREFQQRGKRRFDSKVLRQRAEEFSEDRFRKALKQSVDQTYRTFARK